MRTTRPRLLARVLPLGALLGCTQEPCPKGSERRADGWCYLLDEAGSDSGPVATDTSEDTGPPDDTDSPGSAYTLGDPIEVLGTYTEGGPGMPIVYEWTDAASIDSDWAIATGQGGYGIISMADGTLVHQENLRRALRAASDGRHAILASRNDGFMLVDVSAGPDTRGSLEFRSPSLPGPHEDVAIEGERVLVGWHDNGGVFLGLDGSLLGTLPATDAFAVALQGDRALLTDGPELVLFDVTDVSAPVELDRAAMTGEGRDLDWEGSHAVVGMGGVGTGIWSVVDDTLTHRGDVRTPGTAMSVAVDGDAAWIGAWAVTALVDLTADPPIVVGHETPEDSAMGVAAAGGRAVVADWFSSGAYARVPDTAGPEVHLPEQLFFDIDQASAQSMTVTNHGALELTVAFDTPVAGFAVDPASVELAPGESALVQVRWPEDTRPPAASLEWTSNDPDEATGRIALGPADQGTGTAHEDFTLPGFQIDGDGTELWTLSEARGKVVVLVYWALF